MELKSLFKIIGIQFITVDYKLTEMIPMTMTNENMSPKYFFIRSEQDLGKLKTKLSKDLCETVFKDRFRMIENIKIQHLFGKEEII